MGGQERKKAVEGKPSPFHKGGEVCVHAEDEDIDWHSRMSWGRGKEVSGLGHMSCTLESSRAEGPGCGKDWRSTVRV